MNEKKTFNNATPFEVPVSEIKAVVIDLYRNQGLSLKMVTATDERKELGCFRVWYVFGAPKENTFTVPFICLKDTMEFPSLSLEIHETWNYERQIYTFFGLTPVGHPDLRPTTLHDENWPTDVFPLRKDFDWNTKVPEVRGEYKFQQVEGEGIYEIPVGPIHAGIIEPGHFRFSTAGETIVLLEPRLGFVHKGSEKLFEVLPLEDKVRLSEKISGDSSFSHSLVFCQALEHLSDTPVPERALYLRVIYSELERVANHFGDIGAIMMDTGFSFGGSNGARLREMIMRINERLTGSRFLRGVNTIGGVKKDLSDKEKTRLFKELKNIRKDFEEVIDIAQNSASVMNRLKGTGVLSLGVAQDRGVIGVVGKAVGLPNDARVDYPYAAYQKIGFAESATETNGDVHARFRIRIKEVLSSIDLIQNALQKLPEGKMVTENTVIAFKKNAIAVGVVEGWRGDITYFVTTDSSGDIARVAPRDPSFLNWPAIKEAGFNNVIPDFPLINKSFNQSYSGHDL